MNAIELLIQDHQLVKKLLEELSSTTERAVKKRAELLERIKQEVTIHTALEEEILYPAIKQAGGKEEAKMYYEARRNTARSTRWCFPTCWRPRPVPWNSPAGSR